MPEPAFPIIDAFCRPGPFSTRQPGQPYKMEELIADHATFGIRERLCIHSEAIDGVPEEGNAEMDRLAAANPGTGVIWTVLPPKRFHAEPIDSLMDRARKAGVAMFAMFPAKQAHSLAIWSNQDLYAAMADSRLPLFLDVTQPDFTAIREVAKSFPRLPIVVWNASYRSDRFLVPIMDECKNVHVGLAFAFVQTDVVEEFCGRYGPGRLIFGSSWPLQSPGPFISLVNYANVDDKAKQAIFSGNVARLLSEVKWPVKGIGARK